MQKEEDMNLLQSGIYNILAADTETSSIGDFMNEHLNSDFAMGAVFAGLIFICILIYILNFSSLAKKGNAEQENTRINSIDVNYSNGVELSSNAELVAVITAAIMASLGDEAPADGLYIKSIKRSNGNRWKNA
jgi:Na+-transporting methylmalonyl-CoA/oxaloacetate decarboxylase gamma subunit